MRLSIVVPDRSIAINNIGMGDILEDMSWIPEDVHAIQWDQTEGHIEYKPHLNIPNQVITEIDFYYEKSLETLDAEKQRRDKEKEEAQEAIDAITDFSKGLRNLRNHRLSNCDWTALNDVALSPEKKQEWEQYRQVLRDLPSIVTNPKDLVKDPNHPDWPAPPT